MPMIDGALLFALIGNVYNHVTPPLLVPPLILMSGRGDEPRAQELLKEPGVRAFIAKPFPMNRLIEKVVELFPGAQYDVGPSIQDGFFYNFQLPDGATFSETDLARIEARMQEPPPPQKPTRRGNPKPPPTDAPHIELLDDDEQ